MAAFDLRSGSGLPTVALGLCFPQDTAFSKRFSGPAPGRGARRERRAGGVVGVGAPECQWDCVTELRLRRLPGAIPPGLAQPREEV
jgi:hypothetical protein